ncbi:MAG: flagellar protein FlaG [Butyrivibrio sp.]|jgi:flagellar protein FlaG|uniref:flagellar protein FlaG n=1 Tax=Butyrivibrio sp. TaxID=28121 RepID=UPI001B5747F9|nr:flagellar protein FlaG [Butyrivibrio sp.]MBP3280393.1 flagellar protein FlaG [Butyrivibrio sp.]MBP3783696.1 flagellar protein FlaG [Butyrivibrio sp.]
MGLEAINGFSPLMQQTQPQVKAQVKEQSQSQSEIVNSEASGATNTIDLKVEAADNSSSGGDAQSGAQNFAKSQDRLEATEEQIQEDNEKVRKAISEMTKNVKSNAEAVFGIHDKTNRVTIKMVDKETKKVIKEFPPEETLDMIAKVWEIAGIMVDEKR